MTGIGTNSIMVDIISHNELLELITNVVENSVPEKDGAWRFKIEHQEDQICFLTFSKNFNPSEKGTIVGIKNNTIFISNMSLIMLLLHFFVNKEREFLYSPNICMPEPMAKVMGKMVNSTVNHE